jgi:peptide deformylase
MALRKVLLFPNKRLRLKSRPVDQVDDSIRRLLDDLAETMYAEPGVGLAAPQIGVPLRIFVIDLTSPDGGQLREFINPRVVVAEGEMVWKEGCLSFPGINQEVKRAKQVTIEALDRNGRPFSLSGTELLAVALQHEYDHLEGRLLIDHVSYLKKRMIRREMVKVHQERGEPMETEAG